MIRKVKKSELMRTSREEEIKAIGYMFSDNSSLHGFKREDVISQMEKALSELKEEDKKRRPLDKDILYIGDIVVYEDQIVNIVETTTSDEVIISDGRDVFGIMEDKEGFVGETVYAEDRGGLVEKKGEWKFISVSGNKPIEPNVEKAIWKIKVNNFNFEKNNENN